MPKPRRAASLWSPRSIGPMLTEVTFARAMGTMDSETLQRRYEEASRTLLIEFGTRWTRRKPLLMTIHRALTVGVFVAAGYVGTRFLALLGLYTVMFAIELFEAWRIRDSQCSERHIAAGTMVAMVFIGVGCAFTGGFASPLLPALIAPVIIPAAAFGRRPPTWILLGELIAILAVVLLLPPSVTGPVLPKPWVSIGIAVSSVFAVWLSVVNLVVLTEVYARAAVLAAQMRDEALEQHEARNRRLETVGAKVAHELKNPLAAIAGLVQLLLQGKHEDKTRERLSVIAGEVGRMERVIREYLAFSRPLEDVKLAEVDLSRIADDVLALLEARARERDVVLMRLGEPVRAHVDAARMKEALINLVDNAIEASQPSGTVWIEVARAPEGTILRVRDRGVTIAPDVLARIGTPYFTTRADGTGLGFVMARSAIEQHGGRLELRSGDIEGTVAEIVLPASSSERRAA